MMSSPGGPMPPVVAGAPPPVAAPGGPAPLAFATDGRATPAPPPPASAGGRGLAGLLVLQAVLLMGFLAVSTVAVWMRAGRAGDAAETPRPSPPGATGGSWVAIVELPRKDQKLAALRPAPSFGNEPLQWVPVGSEVDVQSCNTVAVNWCRVRTRGGTLGWMHAPALHRK